MNRTALIEQIRQKQSYLCVGLDTDISKIPKYLLEADDPVFDFNRAIIDATLNYCVGYKINTAFYEAMGMKGWESMEKTIKYIPDTHFTIADAKRGDIGNTSTQYAKAFFETFGFDALTVAPYMGRDSVEPFLNFKDKWTIVLGLTSNEGSSDFQQQKVEDRNLYELVVEKVAQWGSPENLMFVAGATKAGRLADLRKLIPDHFLLVPGVGAQGGSLEEVSRAALNKDCGLLVNASRAILYASSGRDFAMAAQKVASGYARDMKRFL